MRRKHFQWKMFKRTFSSGRGTSSSFSLSTRGLNSILARRNLDYSARQKTRTSITPKNHWRTLLDPGAGRTSATDTCDGSTRVCRRSSRRTDSQFTKQDTQYNLAGISAPVWRRPRAGVRCICNRSFDRARIGADQHVAAILEGLDPLCLISRRDAWDMGEVRFLLHSPRVGDDETSAVFKEQHVQIGRRRE